MSENGTGVVRHVAPESRSLPDPIMHSNRIQLAILFKDWPWILWDRLNRQPPRGNCYILVIVNYLKKWAEAYAMPNQTSETVAKILVNEFVCRFGIPYQIHSEQGSQFEAALFQQLCQLLGMRKPEPQHFIRSLTVRLKDKIEP